jgi:hypothetical protein
MSYQSLAHVVCEQAEIRTLRNLRLYDRGDEYEKVKQSVEKCRQLLN